MTNQAERRNTDYAKNGKIIPNYIFSFMKAQLHCLFLKILLMVCLLGKVCHKDQNTSSEPEPAALQLCRKRLLMVHETTSCLLEQVILQFFSFVSDNSSSTKIVFRSFFVSILEMNSDAGSITVSTMSLEMPFMVHYMPQFITLHRPITQFVESSQCSDGLITLASFSTSKPNKNS